ncbi:hypothetical protein IG631_24202 [Alternaria alternata]|nr:hypothetical protein IG631_24202 [Alternaria alternata]
MLLDAGADVSAQGGGHGNALQAASIWGHEQVVKMLLDAGTDISVQGRYYGNALQAASYGGYEQIVKTLLNAGADVNAQGGRYGNALQAASIEGHEQDYQEERQQFDLACARACRSERAKCAQAIRRFGSLVARAQDTPLLYNSRRYALGKKH